MPPSVRYCRRACRRRSKRWKTSRCSARQFGEVFVDYYLKLKRNEAGRYQRWIEEGGVVPPDDGTTDWEQREYFDFF